MEKYPVTLNCKVSAKPLATIQLLNGSDVIEEAADAMQVQFQFTSLHHDIFKIVITVKPANSTNPWDRKKKIVLFAGQIPNLERHIMRKRKYQ
jgi:hypothetical protein